MKKAVSLLILLMMVITLSAQDKVNSLKLDLKENENAPGTLVAGAEGRANAAGQHIRINVPDMFRPLLITVLAAESKKPLKVSLHSESWANADMNAQTDEDGYCEFKIRAQDAVGVKIVSEQESDYILMAYLGKEIIPEMPSVFTGKKEKKAESLPAPAEPAQKSSLMLYLLIAGGILIAVLILLLVRKKGTKKATLPVLLLIGCSAHAQTEVAGRSDTDIWLEAQRKVKERNKQVGEQFKTGSEKLEKGAKILISGVELWQSYKNLNTCMSSAALPGAPSVPSFCEEADSSARKRTMEPCADCFKEARREFNEVRYKFIKLQTIYRCTKSFADKAKSFGDDVSSIHAVQGLAWQKEKRKIEQSMDRLKKSYDDKYIDLLQRLHNAMMKLDECEAKFGQKNWFDSYGFIFYEFMKESYRRKDE